MSEMQVMDYSQEPRRDILCVDVKSFFASVEAVERGIHPLKSTIAVVSRGEAGGGLVLASAPLVKERYGIKTGSRVFEFPKHANIQVVPPRMSLYVQRNLEILDIFKRYVTDDDLHVYSIDEAFLDVTHSHALYGSTIEIAQRVQRDVWKELGLVVTIGIGDNPLLAKLALDHEAKKDARANFIARWRYEDVQAKLWPITPLSEFWGIGRKTEEKLNRLGIRSIRDIAQSEPGKLKKRYGAIGEELFFHSHGIDRTVLSERYRPKATSFSKSQILPRDYVKQHDVEVVLQEMTEEVAFRLRRHKRTTSLIHVGVGYSRDVNTGGFSRQWTIPATNVSHELVDYVLTLFRHHYVNSPVRTLSVSMGKLTRQAIPSKQLDLFHSVDEQVEKEELDNARDSIRKKFGYTSLLSASSLLSSGRARERAKLVGGHASGEETKK